ncbi:heptaprenylglyceryl phosphate synthase [archaeon]|nr:heptaprenylglyceryl phosphate synthase [archaeon]
MGGFLAQIIMKVLSYIEERLEKGPMHFTLIDPDKQSPDRAGIIAEEAERAGTDVIMVGGSGGIDLYTLDTTVKEIRKNVNCPVILFPGDVSGVSKFADAIFFMSLLNSQNTYYITGAQAVGAKAVKLAGVEPIPMAYLIVEPGGAVGWVGEAKPLPRNKPSLTAAYALAAQYLGFRLIYLEAGSGAPSPVPVELIEAVKATVDIPVIVGGGIKNREDAEKVIKAGANIIVTGTAVEEAKNAYSKVKEIVQALGGE